MTLLVALLLLQAPDYEDRCLEADKAIAAERLRAAKSLESMKTWAWAREEYSKVLRLAPDDATARGKLEGKSPLPMLNEETTVALWEKRTKLFADIARVAVAKHLALAKDAPEGRARFHWQRVLLFAPDHKEATAALGLIGVGLDPIWKDVEFEKLIAKADGGKPFDAVDPLEKQWNLAVDKRQAGPMTYHSIGIPAKDLARILQSGDAALTLMRIALSQPKESPGFTKYLLLVGKERFERYVDDCFKGSADEKKAYKQLSGFSNPARKERVIWAKAGDLAWMEHGACHDISEAMLSKGAPAWIHEGTGVLAELLILGKSRSGCVTKSDETGTGNGAWTGSARMAEELRLLMDVGRVPDLDAIIHVTLRTMKEPHLTKSVSLVKFLMLRWPELYRKLVFALNEDVLNPREAIQKAIGMSVEELDEFWTRWFRN